MNGLLDELLLKQLVAGKLFVGQKLKVLCLLPLYLFLCCSITYLLSLVTNYILMFSRSVELVYVVGMHLFHPSRSMPSLF